MNFAMPPSYFQTAQSYQKPKPAEAPPPTLRHSFEDPNMIYGQQPQQSHVPPQQQPSPQSPPQQAYSPASYTDPYGPGAAPNTNAYAPSYGPQDPYSNQSAYPQAAAQPPQAYQSGYQAAQAQPLPPQAAAQYQPQNAFPQPQSPPAANPDIVRPYRTRLIRNSEQSRFLDHPSIPRLLPQDVQEDLAEKAPAPVHIHPVSRLSVRSTMSAFPSTQTIADTLQIPLGFTIHPFAETKLPEVDFTSLKRMVRCRKCAAYINPFTTFTNGGRSWQCILCRQLNDVVGDYYSPVDSNSGQRHDLYQRPELQHCSVDFYPTEEFLRRPPKRPAFVLVLDCSYPAVSSGMLQKTCQGALAALESMKNADDGLYMSVIGFDATVYFFGLHPSFTAPRVLVAPDTVNDICNVNDQFKLESLELPCSVDELLVPVKESYHLLKELLEKIPVMFRQTKEVVCAFGPAITGAVSILERCGGKIVSLVCSMPSAGEGKLKARFDASKLSNQPKEYTMCAAANDWYKQRALACSNSSISIDLLAGGGTDQDLTTFAALARFTSGSIHRITPQSLDGLPGHVSRLLLRFTAFDCILRVRTSNGLVVTNFYGHCHVREPDLLALPISDEDASYSVEFKIGPNFKSAFAYVQFALVYTTRSRERRIRCHTIQIPITASPGRLLNSANSLGVASFLTKMCVDDAVSMPFPQAQQKATDRLAAILRAAAKQLESQGVRGQAKELVMPETLRFVPQILNGFFRVAATGVATTRTIPPDERVASMSSVICGTPEAMLTHYLGWSYQLYSPYTQVEQLPAPVYASQSYFSPDSVYLVNLGMAVVIWCGKAVPSTVLSALGLEVPSKSEGVNEGLCAASPDELANLRVRVDALVEEQCALCRPVYNAAVSLCPQGNAVYEPSLTRSMTEDAVRQIPSYGDYLLTLYQKVSGAA